MTTRRRYWTSRGTSRDNKNGPGGAGNTDRDLTHSSDPTREGLAVKVTSGPPAPPVNWDERCALAQATLNWRPRCALTGILAMRALQGWSIEQLMAYERGVKADTPRDGVA